MCQDAPTRKLCAASALVAAARRICREHVDLDLALPSFPQSQPGQFVQLLCRSTPERADSVLDWPADGFPAPAEQDYSSPQPFLRRPFSLADRYSAADGSAHLRVISRTIGAGTRWLEQLRPGDTVDLTGPLGRGFGIPDGPATIALVGGGVGIPPLLYLARRLHETGHADVTAVFGATTRDLLPVQLIAEPTRDGAPSLCVGLPGDARFPAIVTSDDGSIGLPGRVTDGLAAWHALHVKSGRPALVFACGPDPMLMAVAQLTRSLGLDCRLCIERRMGCGLGTCLSCVVRGRDAERPAGWSWRLACTDGPVFDRDELLDYAGDPGA